MSAILREIEILETGNNNLYKSPFTATFVVSSKTPRYNRIHEKCIFYSYNQPVHHS